MKQLKFKSCFFLFFLLSIGLYSQTAYQYNTVPNPKTGGSGYVSNPDNVITSSDVSTLNSLLTDLENNNSVQVAVVIVNSIGEENPKDFAVQLFNHWGIGQAANDNGLLIFTVMDQRRTEFETGYGLEGVLPDVVCYRIGMQVLVPYFREGKYGEGLIATVRKIKESLEDPTVAEEVDARNRETYSSRKSFREVTGVPPFLAIYLFISLVVGLIIMMRVIAVVRSKEDVYDKYLSIRKSSFLWLIFLLPLPYILVYFYVRRMMEKFREQPRFSPLNGKPMHKLNEEDDDEFLTEGQITEEEIGSVDYDVWVTDDRDDVMILRYATRFTKYKKCPKCGFITYHHDRTRIVRHATYSSSGKKEVIHRCKHCNYRKVSYKTIPKKTRSSSSGSSSRGGFSGGGGGSSWGGGSSGGGGAGVSW
jgi:uncharacterized protein